MFAFLSSILLVLIALTLSSLWFGLIRRVRVSTGRAAVYPRISFSSTGLFILVTTLQCRQTATGHINSSDLLQHELGAKHDNQVG